MSAARCFASDYDGSMDRYGHVLEELRRDDFRRLRGYAADPRSTFRTWLLVVCRRLCVDYYRSRYGRDREGGPAVHEERQKRRRLADFVVEDLDPEGVRNGSREDPERQLRATELSRALESAVSELTPEERLLLKLRFQDGLPVRAVARVMKYPTVFHVYRRLKPVLSSLRTNLEERGIESPEP
jgi:RNA polymerase sigma factor (sigma-70 family)